MRPLLPVPLTFVRSTPSSRASRRIDGLACEVAFMVASGGGAVDAASSSGAGVLPEAGLRGSAATSGATSMIGSAASGLDGGEGAEAGRARQGGRGDGGGGWLGGGRGCGCTLAQLQDGDARALGHLRADGNQDFLDHAGHGRRHVHGRLVAFQDDERLFLGHGVARLDRELEDGHVVEVAQVGHGHVDGLGHVARSFTRWWGSVSRDRWRTFPGPRVPCRAARRRCRPAP